VVLVRPQQPGNLGAVCRAVKNTGLGRVMVVGPMPDKQDPAARNFAATAQDVLEAVEQRPSISAAVGDCTLVVGTTRRGGKYRHPLLRPREAVPLVLEALDAGPVALLFGPEDHGLATADLQCCQRLVAIPTSPQCPSLNLAQAVLIMGYELLVAAGGYESKPRSPRAKVALIEILLAKLKHALLKVGFLHRQNPEHLMHTIRQVLGRAGLSDEETRILLGLSAQIDWYVRTHPGPPYPGR
jgi:tRNA/rRNA methyltransferase